MFRDFKEYQEITKLYTEKVSKTKDLEENRNTRSSELAAKRLANKPKTREELGLPPIKKKPFVGSRSRFMNKKTEVKKEPEYKPEKGVVFGQRANEVGALGGGKPSSVPVEKSKPEVSTMTKQGKPRTKAQMMAAKRIADGKSISDVKAANTASMKAKAAERNKKFQDAKKSGNLAQFRKDNPKLSGRERAQQMAKDRLARKAEMANEENKMPNAELRASKLPINKDKNFKTGYTSISGDGIMRQDFGNKDDNTGYYSDSLGRMTKTKNRPIMPNPFEKKSKTKKEEYTPYDYVLDYLLTTEQVATIEEANYVMTEMDAETIQGIVEEQKKNLDELALGTAAGVAGAITLGAMGLNAVRKMNKNKQKMDKGEKFTPGSTMDNIQKKKDLYKQMGITK